MVEIEIFYPHLFLECVGQMLTTASLFRSKLNTKKYHGVQLR